MPTGAVAAACARLPSAKIGVMPYCPEFPIRPVDIICAMTASAVAAPLSMMENSCWPSAMGPAFVPSLTRRPIKLASEVLGGNAATIWFSTPVAPGSWKTKVPLPDCVAATDRATNEPGNTWPTVAPAGMPGPLTGSPTSAAVTPGALVMSVEPAVVVPDRATVKVA